MTASTLLNQLRTVGVSIRLSGERLDLTAPRGVLTAERLEQISAVKGELIELLSRPKSGTINNPHRVYSKQKIQCFYCDRGLIRQQDLYWCQRCDCWFRDMGPMEI